MVIAVGGASRSGKTILAKLLEREFLSGEVITICQDDHIYPISKIPTIKGLIDWECPQSINFESLEKSIIESIPNYNYIIVEGFLVFQNEGLHHYYDQSIFININKENFKKRRLKDNRWGDELNWYIEHVWDSYLKYGQLPNSYNYLIVSGTKPIQMGDVMKYLGI